MTSDATPAPVPALMIMGTGSDVGKSLIVAGLCRAFSRRGMIVRPFKPQNMSNNAAVTPEGGEIGRAQALQARACGIPPHTDMNPVLLKPQSQTGSQVIVQGRVFATARARDYQALKPQLLAKVLESFHRLAEPAELLLVEGAGSPAEVNLRAGDIANMGFAEAADLPVILVGDIDRGGVIASLAGTAALLPDSERQRIKGFIINRFRGDVSLFDDGLRIVQDHTGWPSLGVVPWFGEACHLPAEDSVALEKGSLEAEATTGEDGLPPLHIVVPVLPRIANFDDLDPLRGEVDLKLTLLRDGAPLPADADLVVLPGSKTSMEDLATLRARGQDIDILAHHRRGGHILGLCGGYQMLGQLLQDPRGIEGPAGDMAGLGLLELTTRLEGDKTLQLVRGHAANPALDQSEEARDALQGYEMHMGRSEGAALSRPLLMLEGSAGGFRPEGACSADGRVCGSYVHGLLGNDGFRRRYLDFVRADRQGGSGGQRRSAYAYDAHVEAVLDRLADHLEQHLDMDALLSLARNRQ